MNFKKIKTVFILITFFSGTCVFASDDTSKSIASNQAAMSTISTTLGVAQMLLVSSCTTPTKDVECDAKTTMIVGALGTVAGMAASLVAGKSGSFVGSAVTAAMGIVSCQLIKCDTTESRNQLCAGVEQKTVCDCSNSMAMLGSGESCKARPGSLAADYRTSCAALNGCGSRADGTPCPGTCDGCKTSCNGNKLMCESAIEMCDTCREDDDAKFDNTFMCNEDYGACIKLHKLEAQKRQKKCRTTCDAMVAGIAAFGVASGILSSSLNKVKDQTADTGDEKYNNSVKVHSNLNGNTKKEKLNDNNKENPNGNLDYNTNGSTYTSPNGDTYSDPQSGSGSAASNAGSGLGAGAIKGSSSGGGSGGGGSGSSGRGGSADNGKGLGASGSASGGGGGGSYGGGDSYASSGSDGGKSSLKGLKQGTDEKDYLTKNDDLIQTVRDTYGKLYTGNTIGITKADSNVKKKKVTKRVK